MKKLMTCVAFVTLGLSTAAIAHPVNLLFDTRGECEAKQASVNHSDRDNVAGPVFGIQNNGEAQVFFLESFQCEYDDQVGAWHMVNHMGDDTAIGNAWDR